MCKVGLSEDGKYVTYELELVQEIMRYLSGTGTGKSRQLLSKMEGVKNLVSMENEFL